METTNIVAIVSATVGVAGFLFGIYKHFSTRRVARAVYEVSQIADYGVPDAFLVGMATAPVAIKVTSVGSKSCDNLVLRVSTRSQVERCGIEPSDIQAVRSNEEVKIQVSHLNPGQSFTLYLFCRGSPGVDQILGLELSHSEGQGVNARSPAFTTIRLHFPFMDFEFDLISRAFRLVRIGPWTMR
jgi:hypothetical protein